MFKTFALLLAGIFLLKNPATAGDFETRIKAAELAGNREKVAAICQEWHQSGQYSAGVLNWCYNALMSLEPNAVLLTQNDYDTYPIWMLQNALKVREDVNVLNLELLADNNYRVKVMRQYGGAKASADAVTLPELLNSLLVDKGNPLYFSVLLSREYMRTDQKNLYLTGLALKYSTRNFDNVAVLRNNYENLFRTEYLALPLQHESSPEVAAALNMNYIPAFLMLRRHYEDSGETAKAEKLKNLSLLIAQRGGREDEIRPLLYPQTVGPNNWVTSMSAKELDKRMKKVSDKFWAGETEVSNEQYEQFLQDLLKNKAFGLLDTCKTAKTDWKMLLPEALRNLPDAKLFEHGHPDSPDNPVQNISQEAARQYCAWLTRVYNQDAGKKKFKQVLFRLPTAKEWEKMALGGNADKTPYPWGGYYVRNSKGCYLLNMNATEPCKDCPGKDSGSNDGAFVTVKVATYYPNNFGLYNISGNVAEMVAEPGLSKGGSWQDDAYTSQITSEKKYTQPGPWLGFRVVMDVIE